MPIRVPCCSTPRYRVFRHLRLFTLMPLPASFHAALHPTRYALADGAITRYATLTQQRRCCCACHAMAAAMPLPPLARRCRLLMPPRCACYATPYAIAAPTLFSAPGRDAAMMFFDATRARLPLADSAMPFVIIDAVSPPCRYRAEPPCRFPSRR